MATSLTYLALLPLLTSALLSTRQDEGSPAVVYEQFHIESTIVTRYATTRITSVALNSDSVSRELTFNVQLPETAFISDFSMTVNGTTYMGVAKEKAIAEEEFEDRQSRGENVGLVESRGTNLFGIRINTAAESRTTFVLEYEELLLRRLSEYQQVINLNPGNLVEDFQVTVRVIDEQGIAVFNGPDYVTRNRISANEVQYRYEPSVGEQNDQTFGLARDMVVAYDVNHPSNGPGLIVVNDCYFAQFFSPSGVSTIPVDIVFVIDVSGSMSGRKIEQARDSLAEVIEQLRTTDRFSIVAFESTTRVWMNRLVSVAEYRSNGISFARSLVADGGTNFTGGMQDGIRILQQHGNSDFIQLLVMLTDGEPTVGITNPNDIVDLASSLLAETRISLNTLGFGSNLNFDLLVRLALANQGIAQQIYEGEDAAEQLEGFYEEISSPILSSISVSYEANAVESVSQVEFPLLFDGTELVVAGRFADSACALGADPISVVVTGTGAGGTLMFQGVIEAGVNTEVAGVMPSTERLVAYLTIRQLLDQVRIEEDEDMVAALNAEALRMSLQYNFVTELTSLIVVQEGMGADNFTIGEQDGISGLEEVDVLGPSGGGGLLPGSAAGLSAPTTLLGIVLGVVGFLLLLVLYFLLPLIIAALYIKKHPRLKPSNQLLDSTRAVTNPLVEMAGFEDSRGLENGLEKHDES